MKAISKEYRIGFSPAGLLAVLLVMIPNIVWMCFPPANNPLLTNASVYPALNFLETVARLALIALLILLIKRTTKPTDMSKSPLIASVLFLLAYFILWILYFCGVADPMVLLGLAITPSAFFCLYSLWLQNTPATITGLLFSFLHITITVLNYL